MSERIRKSWNKWSDEHFKRGVTDMDTIKGNPVRAFPRDIREMLTTAAPELKGKRVLVPSSGDNQAAFGFSLLGAKVTSTDIAEKQLENAQRIANMNGFPQIEFRQADSMALDGIPDGEFDLVYTSNGTHVWISDLMRMYRSFYRVLKPGGAYVFFDTHPFHRPFNEETWERERIVRFIKPYTATGPFFEERNDRLPTFEWRVQDFLQALLSAGFTLTDYRDMRSCGDDLAAFAFVDQSQYDWTVYPFAALPSWLGVSAVKKQGHGTV